MAAGLPNIRPSTSPSSRHGPCPLLVSGCHLSTADRQLLCLRFPLIDRRHDARFCCLACPLRHDERGVRHRQRRRRRRRRRRWLAATEVRERVFARADGSGDGGTGRGGGVIVTPCRRHHHRYHQWSECVRSRRARDTRVTREWHPRNTTQRCAALRYATLRCAALRCAALRCAVGAWRSAVDG